MASIKDLIHPRSNLAINLRQADCQGKGCNELTRLMGYEAVHAWIQELGPISVGQPSCKRDCCEFEEQPDALVQLDKVCTVVDSGSVRTISRLDFRRR